MTTPSGAGRRPVTATYRLQMHRGFTIRDAAAVTDYLHALGISHVYLSSILAAKPGSTHGYDVTDPGRINPEIGTEEEFEAWVVRLHRLGMGVILDVVPNHMSIDGDNAWWADVLENGPASPYARFFDITWTDHPRPQLHGKVLLPILTMPYGKALDDGLFRPSLVGGAVGIELNGRRLPTDPKTWEPVFAAAADTAKVGSNAEGVLELQSLLNAVRNLPARTETDPDRLTVRRTETAVIKRRLAELSDRHPEVASHVRDAVRKISEEPTALDQFLDAQPYRPCDWRVATDEINYRRFFDVNELAALATELPEVFERVHAKIFDWIARGLVDGLRIDHVDGLFEPKQYIDRLLGRAAEIVGPDIAPPFFVVEKILTGDEEVPTDWAIDGTTGYEFLTTVGGLFVHPAGEEELTRVYEDFTGIDDPFDEILYRKKILALQSSLTGELHALTHDLDRLAQSDRWSRDLTLNGLRHALREIIACFPVYRAYVNGGVNQTDRRVIERAVRRARSRNRVLGRAVYDFIRDTLLLRDPPTGPQSDDYRAARLRFVGRFQQLTPPVMAKGCEDTAFYVYNRLLSLNEVGGHPGQFGRSPEQVHRFLARRAERFPLGLSPLATHDTKRGEDVRARLNVLSEIPGEWGRCIARWRKLNRPHKTDLGDGELAPDANDEYFLYQTLVGTRSDDAADYQDRVIAYIHKAVREAKVHSSWINDEPDYHSAFELFIRGVLDSRKSEEFLTDLDAFTSRVARAGAINSLAQTLIRCTAPGVPDTYQGTELRDLNLVDPDNRRPVDFSRRRNMLESGYDSGEADGTSTDRMKLFVVGRTLRLRRDLAPLFAIGRYVPISVTGTASDHAFAFQRELDSCAVLVVVPRFSFSPVEWNDTAIQIPVPNERSWTNVWTGKPFGSSPTLPLRSLLTPLPIALLVSGEKSGNLLRPL